MTGVTGLLVSFIIVLVPIFGFFIYDRLKKKRFVAKYGEAEYWRHQVRGG